MGASSLHPKKNLRSQKKIQMVYEEEKYCNSSFTSNFSQQHSWISYVRRVREISARTAHSENDMIFWEMMERGTAPPKKAITSGPCGTIALDH